MIDYTDFSITGAVRIVEACLAANQPQAIVPALLDRRSPESVIAEMAAIGTTPQATPRPPTPSPAPASGSIFGEPTPAQRDALTAVLEKRFRAMYGDKAKPAV